MKLRVQVLFYVKMSKLYVIKKNSLVLMLLWIATYIACCFVIHYYTNVHNFFKLYQ